jgi:hypothetical protein
MLSAESSTYFIPSLKGIHSSKGNQYELVFFRGIASKENMKTSYCLINHSSPFGTPEIAVFCIHCQSNSLSAMRTISSGYNGKRQNRVCSNLVDFRTSFGNSAILIAFLILLSQQPS